MSYLVRHVADDTTSFFTPTPFFPGKWLTPALTTILPTPNGIIATQPNIHKALEIVEQIVMTTDEKRSRVL